MTMTSKRLGTEEKCKQYILYYQMLVQCSTRCSTVILQHNTLRVRIALDSTGREGRVKDNKQMTGAKQAAAGHNADLTHTKEDIHKPKTARRRTPDNN